MKKKIWLFLVTSVLLLALAGCGAGQEAEPAPAPDQTFSGSMEGLTLRITDADGGTKDLACRIDAEKGEGWFFLPAYASIESAVLLRGEEELSCEGLAVGESVQFDDGVLTLLQGSAIPAIWIETESGSLDAIQADKSHKESGTIHIVNADGSIHYDGELKQIKGRGNTTWTYEKKPYNIKLAEKADLFGMGESKDWCLLANYRDTSYVRNAMVFDYALGMGVQDATDTQAFDFYVNGEYQGLYQMTEKVEIGKNRLELPDLEEMNEELNPEMDLEDFPVFDFGNEKGMSLPLTPDERDGILLELDFPERWAEEASGFITQAGQHVVVKCPEYASEEQVGYAHNLVQTFESLLLAGDPAYLDYIDLDSWVELYLIEEIFEDVDCGLSSIYFYVKDGKLVAGPLWDFDLTMGASYAVTNPRTLYAAWRERTEAYTSHYLPALYADETFRAAVEEKYEQQWAQGLADLAAKAEDYVAAIADSARMDAARWNKDHAETLSMGVYLKDYLTARREFLTSLWVEGETYHRVRLMGNVYTRYYEHMVRDGETFDAFPELYKEGHTLEGWFYEGTDEPFDPAKPITEETFLAAKWKQN